MEVFKSLQSSGQWGMESRFPDNWKETASCRPSEVVFPDSWKEAARLILNGNGDNQPAEKPKV